MNVNMSHIRIRSRCVTHTVVRIRKRLLRMRTAVRKRNTWQHRCVKCTFEYNCT